ncbi:MAG: hypothetical protein AAGF24_13090 [Cyanobacteria bacterium P01_H01_bin.121]
MRIRQQSQQPFYASLTGWGIGFLFLTPAAIAQGDFGTTNVQANLLDQAICQTSTSGTTGELIQASQPVSVGRQLYTATAQFRSGPEEFTLLTCEVEANDYQGLQLQLGVSDNAAQVEPTMTVNLYQGGTLLESYADLTTSDRIITTLDLRNPAQANPADVAIELVCDRTRQRTDFCELYVLDATLVPTPDDLLASEPVVERGQLEPSQPIEVISPPPAIPSSAPLPAPSESASPLPLPSPSEQETFWQNVETTLDQVERLVGIFENFFDNLADD